MITGPVSLVHDRCSAAAVAPARVAAADAEVATLTAQAAALSLRVDTVRDGLIAVARGAIVSDDKKQELFAAAAPFVDPAQPMRGCWLNA